VDLRGFASDLQNRGRLQRFNLACTELDPFGEFRLREGYDGIADDRAEIGGLDRFRSDVDWANKISNKNSVKTLYGRERRGTKVNKRASPWNANWCSALTSHV
jgi:hypothetical protein